MEFIYFVVLIKKIKFIRAMLLGRKLAKLEEVWKDL